MTTQLVFWGVLAPSKAPRYCDERNAAETFLLEAPALEPKKGSPEAIERRLARLRWMEKNETTKEGNR